VDPKLVRWLDGRWLALARGGHDFGYVSFQALEYGRGLVWEPNGWLGRIRIAAPEVILEETHWTLDGQGVLRLLHGDGWDQVTGDMDFSDEPITPACADATVSTRWLTEREVNERQSTRQ
jgi:hypothetical protein